MQEAPTAARCDWCDAAKAVVNLDGENLCAKCADEWVKSEGQDSKR